VPAPYQLHTTRPYLTNRTYRENAGALWRGLDEVEYATLEWVDWFNHRRLLEPIGHVPPAEFEAAYHRKEDPSRTPELKDPSLR
jgi:transposase InsO family protein